MPRKTRQGGQQEHQHQQASMRPRPDAAENPAPSRASAASSRSFNEAAARCRGKPLRAAYVADGDGLLQ